MVLMMIIMTMFNDRHRLFVNFHCMLVPVHFLSLQLLHLLLDGFGPQYDGDSGFSPNTTYSLHCTSFWGLPLNRKGPANPNLDPKSQNPNTPNPKIL